MRLVAWSCGEPDDGAELCCSDSGWSLTVSVHGLAMTCLPDTDDLRALRDALMRATAPSERRLRAAMELMYDEKERGEAGGGVHHGPRGGPEGRLRADADEMAGRVAALRVVRLGAHDRRQQDDGQGDGEAHARRAGRLSGGRVPVAAIVAARVGPPDGISTCAGTLEVDTDGDLTLAIGDAEWSVSRDEEVAAMELADRILAWLGVRHV